MGVKKKREVAQQFLKFKVIRDYLSRSSCQCHDVFKYITFDIAKTTRHPKIHENVYFVR